MLRGVQETNDLQLRRDQAQQAIGGGGGGQITFGGQTANIAPETSFSPRERDLLMAGAGGYPVMDLEQQSNLQRQAQNEMNLGAERNQIERDRIASEEQWRNKYADEQSKADEAKSIWTSIAKYMNDRYQINPMAGDDVPADLIQKDEFLSRAYARLNQLAGQGTGWGGADAESWVDQMTGIKSRSGLTGQVRTR